MEAIRGCFTCNCRRRTLVNKVLPLVLQVFVIFGVWQIFKSQSLPLEGRDGAASRNLRSAELPICSPGDYSTGKHLRLNAVMSQFKDLQSSQGQSQLFKLRTEVLVRDVEQGLMVLYPVGTLVTFDQDDEDTVEDDDYREYNGNNRDLEKVQRSDDGMDAKVNYVEAKEPEHSQETEVNGDVELENAPEEDQYPDYPQMGVGGARDEHVIDEMLVNDQMLRIKPGDQRGQQEIINQMEDKSDVQIELNQQKQMVGNMVFQMSQNQKGSFLSQNQGGQYQGALGNMPAQAGQGLGLSQSQLGQFQKGLANQPIGQQPDQNPNKSPNAEGYNSVLTEQRKYDTSVQGFQQTNMAQGSLRPQAQQPPNGDIQGQNMDTGHQNQQTFSGGQYRAAQTIDVASQQAVVGTAPLGDAGTLYTEGFAERVNKFKSELYGKDLNTYNDQNANNNMPDDFNLYNSEICNGFGSIDLVYLIHSLPQSDEPRQRIRNTFVDSSYFKTFNIVHAFLVGKTVSPNFQSNLLREQEQYGDILQGTFMDTIENRTLEKGVLGMKWVKQFCPQAKFIMMIDDDVFVDSDKLLRGLIPTANKVITNKAMFCSFTPQSHIPRTGPNAFASDQFPGRIYLRPYCKGFAVLMTQSVVSSLLAASKHVPVFHNLDDLYLYGILPFVVGGVQVYDLGNNRAFHETGVDVVNCYKDLKDKCPYVATKASGAQLNTLWNYVMDRTLGTNEGWEGDRSVWNIKNFIRNF